MNDISEVSEILPNLYLTNEESALAFGPAFELVVNCSKDIKFAEGCKNRVRLPVDDDPRESTHMFQCMQDVDVLAQMHTMITNNKRVLVHCKAGAQRSPAVVGSYLIRYRDMTPDEAVQFIRSKRKVAFFCFVNFEETLELVYNKIATHVLPNLFIGSYLEIPETATSIICVAPDFEFDNDNNKYNKKTFNKRVFNYPITSLFQTDLQNKHQMKNAVDKIAELLKNPNEVVFVHCLEGVNRSPAIVIIYLNIYEKMDLHEAVAFIKNKRPGIYPDKHLNLWLG